MVKKYFEYAAARSFTVLCHENIPQGGSELSSAFIRRKREASKTIVDIYKAYIPKLPLEVAMFIQVKSNDNEDPLQYWKRNEAAYPILSAMAKDYLAVPGSSASSERVFSAAKNVVTLLRNRLMPDTVKYILRMKSWTKYVKEFDMNVDN